MNWLPPALTAFVAVLTATVGYFITNRLKTLEVRRATYASALLAVETYWRMPYRIRRRADSRPETRGALGERISDAERDLDYYINLMDLDVDDVAARYRALALETRARGTAMRAQAWCMPPADRDDAMPFPERYPDDDRSALEHRDNLHKCKPQCAEGSGCWRFAEPGKTSPGAQQDLGWGRSDYTTISGSSRLHGYVSTC